MPREFHHPYNFIQVTDKVNGQPTHKTEYCQIKAGGGHGRHDLWLDNHYSGRVICRLHLKTPTVVGNQHEGAFPALVKPYERNGQPAIPGNSLRGMIGSVSETLSQSSLRVLGKRPYSVREPVEGGRSAIGILLKSRTPNRFDILPLTLPALKTQAMEYPLHPSWKSVFEVEGGGTAAMGECLPAYVNGYTFNRTRLDYQAGSFLDINKPDAFSMSSPRFYYARLHDPSLVKVLGLRVGDKINVGNSELNEKRREYKGRITHTLIGQKIAGGMDPILSEAKWNEHGKPSGYTKGILRVLGIEGRQTDLPATKSHELFIPYPPSKRRKRIPVLQQAIEEFKALAQERNVEDQSLPYTLKGCSDATLREGQLVYFDIKDDKRKPVVYKISISAIWRKRLDSNAWDFFEEIDDDLVPWNRERTSLTPAELLFGVVEHRERENETNTEQLVDAELPEDPSTAVQELPPTRAFASRVRFHDALPLPDRCPGILEHPITLKILSSPKPPCPAMYFHPKDGLQAAFIEKTKLNISLHRPNGRKVYLHHPPNSIKKDAHGKWPWETRDDSPSTAKQKVRCTPLDADQDFFFHVDFDNLSKTELTLLLISLCPDTEFHHRLGLGKSLGLGSVRVDIEAVCLIDRHRRYGRTALQEPRYHNIWHPAKTVQSTDWKPLYPEEANAAGTAVSLDLDQAEFYDASLIDRDTLSCLKTIGHRDKLKPNTPVQPPLLDEQHPERETFAWFVENEKRGRQMLPPIANGSTLPYMNTYGRRAPRDR